MLIESDRSDFFHMRLYLRAYLAAMWVNHLNQADTYVCNCKTVLKCKQTRQLST